MELDIDMQFFLLDSVTQTAQIWLKWLFTEYREYKEFPGQNDNKW